MTTDTTGLTVGRVWTTAGVHPYDEVRWGRRDVVMTNWRDGSVNFEQRGVEFPDFWSENAVSVVTTKYFYGAVGTETREWSLRQLVDRVVRAYGAAGERHGYLATPEDTEVFEHELTWMLIHQVFSFNSPVWFNVGTPSSQQVSACFILAVEDTMESILDWYREEGLIFKRGSGAGVNLSRLRSSHERLSSGGTASGPVSFMRGADASAGTIKSGGATRRAAKMVILDVDHPDIEEFIETKAREERKIRVLRDAGFEMDLGERDTTSVQYQNANNSVRVSDAFMRAVEDGREFALRARTTDAEVRSVGARELFQALAQAAWECADPGVQYDDTINSWHTNPEAGRVTASNPCSEYMSLDNSSCNLASLNLLKFRRADGTFDTERFIGSVELVTTAMDISICFADFPTGRIAETTRAYRQLGVGYANLGALLMANGLPYDSDGGRALAAAITSLMTATVYLRSAQLAGVVGAYDGYARDRAAHQRVVRRHADANLMTLRGRSPRGVLPVSPGHDPLRDSYTVATAANTQWRGALQLGDRHGYRNAQASLLAPTGTIALMMDCDTTGIEPDFSLVKLKKLVGGASLRLVNQIVPLALRSLGYTEERVEAVVAHVTEHGHMLGAPGLRSGDYPVFDCAVGERAIAPMGHVRMMAAVQPFLSGAISKTVNMPARATVEDVERVYLEGWHLGLKSLAVYRDGCKVGQPLSAAGASTEVDMPLPAEPAPARRRLPKRRPSETVSFVVGGAKGYLTASSYPDDGLGELFLKMSKQGSTLAGVMDAFSIAISIGLQYGVPLETYVSKFINTRFDPAGVTDDPDVRLTSSVMDYVFRRLALDFLPTSQRVELGVLTTAERVAKLQDGGDETPVDLVAMASSAPVEPMVPPGPRPEPPERAHGLTVDAPLCLTCGTRMRAAGSCYLCEGCGSTSGCS